MAPTGRILVVEHVIPRGNGAHWAKLLDINIFVIPGGKERSRLGFAGLCKRAGMRVRRIVPTACPLSIVEAVRA